MDLFNDVTQHYDFLRFSFKQKFISMNRFLEPNLDNLRRFNIYNEMYARGQPLSIYFFLNIGKFGLSNFREFGADFPETPRVNLIRYEKSIHGDGSLL